MKTFRIFVFLALAMWGGSRPLQAGVTRTQNIVLRAGWNAVFLEVQPSASEPAVVFGSLPVETVASFIPARVDSQYLRSPGDAPWRDEGWVVWHTPIRPDAFLSNLHQVQAQRAYLILAKSDFTWTITGEPRATRLEWYPNTCTLTGLPVDELSPPTFAEFFSGSPEHRRLRVFRLESGNWKRLRDPAVEKVRSGEAYWIETEGGSNYQGPMRVAIPGGGALDFDWAGGARSLEIQNDGVTGRARFRAELIQGPGELPLQRVVRDLGRQKTIRTPMPATLELGELAAGQRTSIRLEADRGAMRAETGEALLKIRDGRGTVCWLPVRARREPLALESNLR